MGRIMRGEDDSAEDADGEAASHSESDMPKAADDYYGGKWGVFLRAPDLWFELTNQYSQNFCALGQLV